jgi:hypothetical protein
VPSKRQTRDWKELTSLRNDLYALQAKHERSERLLEAARAAVLASRPWAVQELFLETLVGSGFKSIEELRRWEGETVQRLLALATPVFEHPSFGTEAICPACGGSPTSPYRDGFKLPEGLRRHLTGSYGHRCTVMRFVTAFAREQLERNHPDAARLPTPTAEELDALLAKVARKGRPTEDRVAIGSPDAAED